MAGVVGVRHSHLHCRLCYRAERAFGDCAAVVPDALPFRINQPVSFRLRLRQSDAGAENHIAKGLRDIARQFIKQRRGTAHEPALISGKPFARQRIENRPVNALRVIVAQLHFNNGRLQQHLPLGDGEHFVQIRLHFLLQTVGGENQKHAGVAVKIKTVAFGSGAAFAVVNRPHQTGVILPFQRGDRAGCSAGVARSGKNVADRVFNAGPKIVVGGVAHAAGAGVADAAGAGGGTISARHAQITDVIALVIRLVRFDNHGVADARHAKVNLFFKALQNCVQRLVNCINGNHAADARVNVHINLRVARKRKKQIAHRHIGDDDVKCVGRRRAGEGGRRDRCLNQRRYALRRRGFVRFGLFQRQMQFALRVVRRAAPGKKHRQGRAYNQLLRLGRAAIGAVNVSHCLSPSAPQFVCGGTPKKSHRHAGSRNDKRH